MTLLLPNNLDSLSMGASGYGLRIHTLCSEGKGNVNSQSPPKGLTVSDNFLQAPNIPQTVDSVSLSTFTGPRMC